MLLAIPILLSCYACQNNEDYLSSFQEFTVANNSRKHLSHKVSEKEAVAEAIAFIKSSRTETRSNEELEVGSVIPWRSSDILSELSNDTLPETRSLPKDNPGLPDTMLYIINFLPTGYSLVSADNRVPGVMAYVPQGQRFMNSPINNPGVRFFLNGLTNHFRAVSIDTTIVPKDTITYSMTQFQNPDSIPMVPMTNPFIITNIINPIMTTKWGQGDPYNRLCFTDGGSQAVAGCVAIAIDQVLAHHEFPASYDGHTYHWDEMTAYSSPVSDTACNDVAHLVHETGKLVDMSYGTNVSTASSSKIDSCLNVMGCHFNHETCVFLDPDLNGHYGWGTAFSFERLMTNFQNNRPVIIGGQGYQMTNWGNASFAHAWVLDGGLSLRYVTQLIRQMNDTFIVCETVKQEFVHCNWGWNGTDDGYYITDAFSKKYDDNLGLILQGIYHISLFIDLFYDVYPSSD